MGITGPACFGFERQWFSKSIKHLFSNQKMFDPENIEETKFVLGLGNRQVLATEYWLRCAMITEKSKKITKLTPFGEILYKFDPYFEEQGTWLSIHHELSFSRDGASTYWFAFRKMPSYFTKADLLKGLHIEFKGKKERTYTDAVSVFYSIAAKTEINFLCKLVTIKNEIINKIHNSDSLKPGILAYILCNWASRCSVTTANIADLLSIDGPITPFSLSKDVLFDCLDQIQDRYAKRVLWVSRTAGLDSITFAYDIPALAVLRSYYLEHLEGLEPINALHVAIDLETKARKVNA